MITPGVDGAAELQHALARLTTDVKGGAVVVVAEQTMALEADVKRRASEPRSRPRPLPTPLRPEGPRALTGGYRGSIGSRVDVNGFTATGSVGSNDVRAASLEFGHDDLFGRGIHMRAYPHYGPAMDDREPAFTAALAGVVAAAAQRTRGGRLRGIVARLFGRGAA